MILDEKRKDCPMRHKNGNCLPAGGFCTAVNYLICEALHNAYQCGYKAAEADQLYDTPSFGSFHDY